jgi:hypothetical protein
VPVGERSFLEGVVPYVEALADRTQACLEVDTSPLLAFAVPEAGVAPAHSQVGEEAVGLLGVGSDSYKVTQKRT